MSITTRVMTITPQMATALLANNVANRPLRRTVVDTLKAALGRGEYIMTHQGIAFNEAGELVDGQHRLTAISELDSGAFPMLVTSGLPQTAFAVLDQGLKRTASDALNESPRLVEVARLLAVLMGSTPESRAPTPTMLRPYIAAIAQPHNELVTYAPSRPRVWSGSAVRLAAVASMLSTPSNSGYVKDVYRALVTSDFEAMPAVAHVLVRAATAGSVSTRNYADLVARCLVVFDPTRANIVRIMVRDTADTVAFLRDLFSHLRQA